MFGRKASDGRPAAGDAVPAAGDMAVDTLAAVLRSLAEFALDQEAVEAAAFRRDAEAWARHVTVAAPPPGREEAPASGRRDWEGVRKFVREYCRSSASHAASVTGDLREVIWVFIRNFTQAFARDEELDARVQEQVARLERVVAASATSELKREVLGAVGALAEAFQQRRERARAQMAALGETVRALGDELDSARREGETDALTRVANRKALDAYLERTVEVHRAFEGDASLLVVDVDHFKAVNDRYGHVAGDEVLRAVADAVVRVFLRKSDFVARFGGDELAVVLRETSLDDALALAARAAARVRDVRVAVAGAEIQVTVSIGVARLEPGEDVRSWFARADRGLYAAKAAGRDCARCAPSAAP